jgi:MinD-like ATPase involved in chromosome partitioning or flagellar assembly
VNLATSLYARIHTDILLAELLPGQGALALDLGVDGIRGLTELLSVSKLNEITHDRVNETLVGHASGLKLFLSSDRPRDMHLINQLVNYETIIKRLAGLGRFLTLDMGVGMQPFAEKILPLCNEVIIVIEGNPNTIVHARALIADIGALGIPKSGIHVVLNNRVRSDTQLPTSQVQAKLEHEIISTLTPAPELFAQATRMQTPAVLCQPESLTARQIMKVVDMLIERETQPR